MKEMVKTIEFVSYDGTYPNLCSGELVLCIDGKKVNLGCCLCSGGCVWFDEDWNEHVEEEEWSVDVPKEFEQYVEEITNIVNENVPWGCCGGCI